MDRSAGYGEVDALITDAYLDSLLTARQRRAWDVPSVAELDPSVRAAAARLADAVVRVHPSFRFEERLAARLAEAAGAMALPRVAGDEGVRLASDANGLAFALDQSGLGPLGSFDLDDPAHPEPFGGIPRRPLLIGGTLASAAISIAGAAIVAWRWNRAANSGHSGVRFI